MFVKYSVGFVVLPGGLGTWTSSLEAVTLVQTQKVTSFPIVLVGVDYWSGLLTGFDDGRGPRKMGPGDVDLFHLTDDPEEAVNLIAEPDRAAMGRPTKHARRQSGRQAGR